MTIQEKYNAYKKANEDLKLIKEELLNLWVEFYCEREEINIGDQYEDDGGKGTITRIVASVRGDITVYWKKHKKDGSLYQYESEAYTTGKYVMW